MPAPDPRYGGTATGHPAYILFTGSGDVKELVATMGMLFDAEVADDTVHALIVDPRWSTQEVADYIVELGGSVYVPPSPE